MLRISNRLENALSIHVNGVYFPFSVAEEFMGDIFHDIDGNECQQTRRFLTFRDVDTYLDNISTYNHCHELIVPQTRNNSFIKCIGRIAFDFDIPISIKVPHTFFSVFENTVRTVFSTLYTNVDISKFRFVWLLCDNPKKTSIHLVVKDACLKDWVEMLKLLYHQLIHIMKQDRDYDWIDPNILIDTQLARKNATLRMPLNSKIGGYPLYFRSPSEYSFRDGLICQYDKISEQVISMSQCTEAKFVNYSRKITKEYQISSVIAEDAYEFFCKYGDPLHSFKIDNVCESYISLLRVKPSKCIISGKYHESDNAYIFVSKTHNIYFFCRRGCEALGKMHKLITMQKNNSKKQIQFT